MNRPVAKTGHLPSADPTGPQASRPSCITAIPGGGRPPWRSRALRNRCSPETQRSSRKTEPSEPLQPRTARTPGFPQWSGTWSPLASRPLFFRRVDHDVRTRRAGGHQPRRAVARFGGQSGGLGCSERHVDYPSQVRVLHLPACGIKACARQNIERPRLSRHGEFPVLHLLEADFVTLWPSHLLRQEFTAPRHEWLQILVVAGNIEGGVGRAGGETDQFVLALSKPDPAALGIIPEHRRAYPQFRRRRQNRPGNLYLRWRNVRRGRNRSKDHDRKHVHQFHSRSSLRTRGIGLTAWPLQYHFARNRCYGFW